jgi:flagellar basal body-associated protein FliL
LENEKKIKQNNHIKIQMICFFGALLSSGLIYIFVFGQDQKFKDLSNIIKGSLQDLNILIIPVVFLFFIITGLLTSFLINKSVTQLNEKPVEKKPTHITGKKEKEYKDRRMYLNLLSILQREGRLLDFFSEDLSDYEDSQIGATVRGVHESCSKILEKYVDMTHVLTENEGEEIIIEEDFDPDTIKLTGNVTGKPPFKGIVTHRGWQAKKADLPRLSESVNSKLITPAEVEIK